MNARAEGPTRIASHSRIRSRRVGTSSVILQDVVSVCNKGAVEGVRRTVRNGFDGDDGVEIPPRRTARGKLVSPRQTLNMIYVGGEGTII